MYWIFLMGPPADMANTNNSGSGHHLPTYQHVPHEHWYTRTPQFKTVLHTLNIDSWWLICCGLWYHTIAAHSSGTMVPIRYLLGHLWSERYSRRTYFNQDLRDRISCGCAYVPLPEQALETLIKCREPWWTSYKMYPAYGVHFLMLAWILGGAHFGNWRWVMRSITIQVQLPYPHKGVHFLTLIDLRWQDFGGYTLDYD